MFRTRFLNCFLYKKVQIFFVILLHHSFADIKFMIGGGVLTLWWLYDDDVVINDDDVDGDAVNNDKGDAFVDDDWWWWCWCMGDRYKASPLSSLGVSQAHITYFFFFSNKLLMKIIWEWPPLFSFIGFSILNLV